MYIIIFIYISIIYLKTNINFKDLKFIINNMFKPNGFIHLQLKSTCIHGIVPGFCGLCIAASQAAAAKRKLLLTPIIIPEKPAFSSPIANCEHIWAWISDNEIRGTMCDFAMPIHDIQTGLANFCINCHAIGCLTCT